MITGDLDRALGTEPGSAGTWRPAQPGASAEPGVYATSVAFLLARPGPGAPARIAAGLARRLSGLDWVATAEVTGGGYVTVAVTADALARVAVRIAQAGPGCARSGALRGEAVTASPQPRLAEAEDWDAARRMLAGHVTARLAEAAGATVTWVDESERPAPHGPLAPRAVTSRASRPQRGPARDGAAGGARPSAVAEAIAYAGIDAVVFALSLVPGGGRAAIDARTVAAHLPSNPAYAVRYAHAHAASALRQAADLGLVPGDAAGFVPRLLAHPGERSLLHELSWLPERAAGAARRGQPDAFARYLSRLAEMYLSCQESCPATWPGMAAPDGSWGVPSAAGPAPPGRPGASPGESLIVARLWLAAAAREALAAGLGLLGVHAPGRL